jgi:hypothetical protein
MMVGTAWIVAGVVVALVTIAWVAYGRGLMFVERMLVRHLAALQAERQYQYRQVMRDFVSQQAVHPAEGSSNSQARAQARVA